MTPTKMSRHLLSICAILSLLSASAFAQFTAGIQGVIQDPSGARIANANIRLENTATSVTATTTSDSGGNYRFISLAPGDYKITVEASGFAKTETSVTLVTEQSLSVPITLKVGAVTEAVTVTSQAPVLDTADDRNQLTLDTQAVAELPVAGRNLVTLTTMAAGSLRTGNHGRRPAGHGRHARLRRG